MRFGAILDFTFMNAVQDTDLRHKLVVLAVDKTFSPLHYKRQEEEVKRLEAEAPKCPVCSGSMRLIDKPGMKFWGCAKYNPDGSGCSGSIDFAEWDQDRDDKKRSEGKEEKGGIAKEPPKKETREGPGIDNPQPDLSSITSKRMRNELRTFLAPGDLLLVPPEFYKDDDCVARFYHRMREHGTTGWDDFVRSFRK